MFHFFVAVQFLFHGFNGFRQGQASLLENLIGFFQFFPDFQGNPSP